MKTKTNSRMMGAAVVGMMVLAGACGMPDDGTDEHGSNAEALGVKTAAPKAAKNFRTQFQVQFPIQQTTPTYELKTTDAKVAGQVPVSKAALPLASTLDLYVAVDYQNVTGTHTQAVQVYSPDGSFYQGFNQSVCIDGGCITNLPESVGTVAQYWVSLPVAGSYISQYNITGAWRVDLYVDGAKTASASVVLQ